MSSKCNPDTEFIRSFVSYDRETGLFKWNERRFGFKSVRDRNAWNTRYAGQQAGTINKTGYAFITIGNKHYAAAQIAWVIVNGEWPNTDVDHIDGNPANNRYSNLRLATRSENVANRGIQRNNKTGFKGVSFNSKTQKYYAQISMNGNRKHIGSFNTAEEAAKAYSRVAIEWHGEFARTASAR